MKKTGILGGTFNPIHWAHLSMAYTAWSQAQLDEIWFMPSKNPPHKSQHELVNENHRSRMIQLAIEQESAFQYSDYELKRDGTTYSAETLLGLNQEFPENQFYFIMGGDSFFQLESWYLPEIIMKHCHILAVSRDGATHSQMEKHALHLLQKYQANIQILQMDSMAISSSQVRQSIQEGKEITSLVPQKISDYIQLHHLYE